MDKFGDRGGCLGLHSGEHVRALLHREGRRLVAETFLITLTGTPALSAIVACVCRRSWSRMRGRPERATMRSKVCVTPSGCNGGAVLATEDEIAGLVVARPVQLFLLL